MKKKRILIVFTGAMEIGGIERSLIGLLDSFDYNKYEVDLFLYGHHGPLYPYINEKVTILNECNELAYLRESLGSKIKHHAYYSAYRRLLDGIRHLDNDISWRIVLDKCLERLEKKYDLAISFFLPFDLIRDKVDARIRIGWIHTDYSAAENIDTMKLSNAYSGLDYIVAVSDACKDTFLKVLPKYEKQTLVVENILSSSFIKKQAEEFSTDGEMLNDGSIKILSVGRYTNAKNFDNVPEICSKLISKGLNVKWYLIGFGSDENLIRSKISEFSMESHVFLLGKKINPYPYFKACDVYIQPSRYEGKCVAVREAQILGKPVIITDFPTAGGQLENGIDGAIVPRETSMCANAIYRILIDKDYLQMLAQNCIYRDYSNIEEVKKIYKLMDYDY